MDGQTKWLVFVIWFLLKVIFMSKRDNMFARSTIPHICRGPHVFRMYVVLLWAPPTPHTILMIELDRGIFFVQSTKANCERLSLQVSILELGCIYYKRSKWRLSFFLSDHIHPPHHIPSPLRSMLNMKQCLHFGYIVQSHHEMCCFFIIFLKVYVLD